MRSNTNGRFVKPATLPASFAVVLLLALAGCAGDATPGDGPTPPAVAEEASEAPVAEDAEEAPPTPSSHASACERLTPDELSAAFDAAFAAGNEVADNQCVFTSDASHQFRVQIYPGASATCEMMGAEYDQVEVAGSPGWWDVAGAQMRACMPDESVALTLAGGGGDNSVHRQSMLDLITIAANR